jgi:hypothetical protein
VVVFGFPALQVSSQVFLKKFRSRSPKPRQPAIRARNKTCVIAAWTHAVGPGNFGSLWPPCCCPMRCGISSNLSFRFHHHDGTVEGRAWRIAHVSPASLRAPKRDPVAVVAAGTGLWVGDDVLAARARLATGGRVGSDPRCAPGLARSLRPD